MTDGSETTPADEKKVHALVKRVLRSGGRDLNATEELVFLQMGDPLDYTSTKDPTIDLGLLHQAFDDELSAYLGELLADDELTADEALRLRSSVMAASGPMFDPVVALAPYEDALAHARAIGMGRD